MAIWAQGPNPPPSFSLRKRENLDTSHNPSRIVVSPHPWFGIYPSVVSPRPVLGITREAVAGVTQGIWGAMAMPTPDEVATLIVTSCIDDLFS